MLFYKDCFGGDLFLLPLSDSPIEFEGVNESTASRILHATLTAGALKLMAADTLPGESYRVGNNLSVMLKCGSVEQMESLFALMSAQGSVFLPLQDTFWAARFGMLVDRYGIHWRLQYDHPKEDLGL